MITPSAGAAQVPMQRLQPSAWARSKTGRDSYFVGVKRASHDAPSSGEYKSPPVRGGATAAFKSTSDRHSYLAADRNRFADVNYTPQSDFTLSQRAKSPSAAFRPSRSARDSHIRGSHQVASTAYDVPGMADSLKTKKSGFGLMKGSSNRDSYMRELKGRFGDNSARVPGVGDVGRRSQTPTAAFRGSPGKGRDSYCREAQCRSFSPSPNVGGMAAQVAARKTGKFLGGNGDRYGYIKASPKAVDAVYDVPGMADVCKKSSTPRGSSFRHTADRYSYLRDAKRDGADCSYAVPGMADRPTSPCIANSSFRSTERRHSYLTAEGKPATDAVYDLPGMVDSMLHSPQGRFSKSPAHRDSHIRAERKFVDATYNVPGMAELNGSMVMSGSFVSSIVSPKSAAGGMGGSMRREA